MWSMTGRSYVDDDWLDVVDDWTDSAVVVDGVQQRGHQSMFLFRRVAITARLSHRALA